MWILPAPAFAGVVVLDVPAGPLGQAVQAIGRQTGTTISVEDKAIWGWPVSALRGRLGAREALTRLARAAGAEVKSAGPQGFRIVAARARMAAPAGRRFFAPESLSLEPVVVNPEEIVVTASKRDAKLRDYPGQANLIAGEDLTFGGNPGTDAILSRLASLSSTHLGSGRNKLFIRGIADSSFTGPTQATVGQYLGDVRLSYNAPDPDLRLYDIGSVEVLEGPQGALYGAGSLGGIIRLVPNEPDMGRTSGAMAVGGSATQHGDPGADAAALFNLPLVEDKVALRAVAYGAREGGYIDRPFDKDINRTNTAGGRATLRIDPGDGWTIDLGGVFQRTRGLDSQYADANGPPLSRLSTVPQGFHSRYALAQLVVSKDWGALHFRSSSGLIGQHLDESYDATTPFGFTVPGTPMAGPTTSMTAPIPPSFVRAVSFGEQRVFVQRNNTRLFATESRLWQPMIDGFGWVVGGSFTSNRTRLDRAIGLVGATMPTTGVVNRIAEGTIYGEASLAPFDGLVLTAGGRITHSRLSGTASNVEVALLRSGAGITASRKATSALPSLGAIAQVLPGVSLFARYQEGFRPGGLAIEGPFVRRFKRDRVGTTETGVRLDRGPVDLSASLSYSGWQDIQADYIDGNGLPSTSNIGDGRIWSLSANAGWRPLAGLRLEAGGTYNDSRVTEPNTFYASTSTGTGEVPNVARFTGRLGANYVHAFDSGVTLKVDGWVRYVGKSRLGIGPILGEEQGNYLDSALTARVGRPKFGVTLGLTNLSDEIGNRFALGTPFATGRRQITPLRPRTIRIGLDTAF